MVQRNDRRLLRLLFSLSDNTMENEEIKLQRINDRQLLISRNTATPAEGLGRLRLYTDPQCQGNPVMDIEAGNAVTYSFNNLVPTLRYYVQIQAHRHELRVISERRVFFSGSVNFRDLGGYRSKNGEFTRWGTVFRSDGLSRLTESDLVLFSNLGIKTVIDFRTEREKKRSPDRIPDDSGIKLVSLPILSGEFDYISAVKHLTDGSGDWPEGDFMVGNYLSYLTHYQHIWKAVFEILGNRDNLPLVFHCTGGKDRTGACAGLILGLAEVPENIIVSDHQLSNQYIASIVDEINKRLKSQGLDPQKLAPFLEAPKNAIETFLYTLNSDYGSAFSFLEKECRVDSSLLDSIRQGLLSTDGRALREKR